MYTQLQSKIRLLRVIDGKMLSSDCMLKFSLESNKEGTELLFAKKLTEINIWVNMILNNSIAYNPTNSTEKLYTILNEFTNNLITTPFSPNDYNMTALIYAKLNAIGDDYIKIPKLSFESDTGDGFIISYTDESENWLPTIKEWLGDITYFDTPWWHRSDGGTIDVPVIKDRDLTDIPDILIDLNEFVNEEYYEEDHVPQPNKKAEIIKPIFKPVVLNGADKFTK